MSTIYLLNRSDPCATGYMPGSGYARLVFIQTPLLMPLNYSKRVQYNYKYSSKYVRYPQYFYLQPQSNYKSREIFLQLVGHNHFSVMIVKK